MTDTLIHILLVEDNATDALLLEHELSDSSFGPFSIHRAERLDDAIGHLESHRCDVVLLDLGLPDSQGLATLRQMLGRNARGVPIVVLTDKQDKLLGVRAMHEGAVDHLVKSGSGDTVQAIRHAIDRKKVSEAFMAAEEKLTMAVHAAELGLFNWDVRSGNITWSYYYARLLGLLDEEFDGTFDSFKRCVHPQDRAAVSVAIERSISAREDYRHEYRVVWPDSSEHWIEGRGKVFNDDHGKPLRLMGTVMDISKRKTAEESARVREAELARLADANLTPRELALLKLIASGLPNKRIATIMNISIKTVAKHRAHLMAKTNALNAADLARMSTLAGLAVDN
jgi:two-component system, NarL family, sensor histidine kinase UhpB